MNADCWRERLSCLCPLRMDKSDHLTMISRRSKESSFDRHQGHSLNGLISASQFSTKPPISNSGNSIIRSEQNFSKSAAVQQHCSQSPQLSESNYSRSRAAVNRYQNQIRPFRFVSTTNKSITNRVNRYKGLVLSFLALSLIGLSETADVPMSEPVYSAAASTSVGPSLCPLVPSCQCKWVHGKQVANCGGKGLANIPSQLPRDTQVLDMTGSRLVRLGPHIFQDKNLPNLQKIILSDCKISLIADSAFDQLSNLVELDLSNNEIQQIPVKALEQHRSLRKLSLAYNPIQIVEPESFSSLVNLNSLDLSNCQLSQLKPQAFKGLSRLKELKLHENRLAQLEPSFISDLAENTTIELYSNPWNCDCELKQTIDWMRAHNIQQSTYPTCASPQRHRDLRWSVVKPDEFICPPVIINQQNEVAVGAGSNYSLVCMARGSPPLAFIWFQDEKNLTQPRSANGSSPDPPPTTKLLEEKRYEIAEELGPGDNPNVTKSILYLYNLRITDTSLFLCWVENVAGYTIANFSLTINDSPPINSFATEMTSVPTNFLSQLGLRPHDADLIVAIVILSSLLIAAVIFIVVYKHSSRSSKSSQSSDIKRCAISTMSSANKFSLSKGNITGQANSSMLAADSDDDNGSDLGEHSAGSTGSGSSCRKSPRVMADAELNGFIEHMRSGIINMDYHDMSPVIQFNNTLKKQQQQQLHGMGPHGSLDLADELSPGYRQRQQHVHPNNSRYLQHEQPMQHFTNGSNASNMPYYGNATNGSASMTTTTSDLSPSSGSGTASFAGQNQPMPSVIMTSNNSNLNCDPHLQHMQQLQQQQLFHQLQAAPPANATATSYAGDNQSGFGEHDALVAMMGGPLPQQLRYEHQDPMGGSQFRPASSAAYLAPSQQQQQMLYYAYQQGQAPMMRPGSSMGYNPHHRQTGELFLQDLQGGQASRASSGQQHHMVDPDLHIL